MSDIKRISPLLDNFDMGDPISEHDGVRCYPAMARESDDKYIVKIISIPASQTQVDALLLTGAYPNEEAALSYFKDLSTEIENEVALLQRLAQLEGFVSYDGWQTVQKEDETGYQVYLLGAYQRTLERNFERNPMTHLSAVNLGLDLCAALAVCRRSGYLYVDLKPSNIYIINDKDYRIGDLGFVRLDSLKYASMPDKYRSAYTAPEIQDAFSALNTTMDVYAVGLILYQAYNNGVLPQETENGDFAAPEYADYEMAEIILKACARNPENRWQDPIAMGQALVSYMQRNSVNDTPIVPVIPVQEDVEAEELPEDEPVEEEIPAEITDPDEIEPPSEEDSEPAEPEPEEAPLETEEPAEASQTPVAPEVAPVPVETDDDVSPAAPEESEQSEPEDPESPYEEDDFGNLSFLLDGNDETDPGNMSESIDYGDVSDEVSQILAQADALADHPVPEPVTAPDPIEVPMPEPLPLEDDPTEPEEPAEESDQTDAPVSDGEQEDIVEPAADPEEQEPEEVPIKKSGGKWLVAVLITLAALALAAAAFLYYNYFYLMPINAITLDGSEDTLVVLVDSDVDETLLTVVCTDSHGIQMSVPVVDGKATFENLVPNTAYNVKLIVDGFHKLTGDTATAYSTPAQTNIVQFSAVTGAEDGSVILGFTVEGPDAGQWAVVYASASEPEKTVSFPAHMVTLSGLTVGQTYTFRLIPDTDLYVTGTTEITFTAAKLVYAQDLRITSLTDGKLTVAWNTPVDSSVSGWTVRCYNDAGYNETVITAENEVTFEGLSKDSDHTVEVTAAGMSVSQRIYVPKNAFTVSNFQVDNSNANKLVLTWDTERQIPESGWLLTYSVDDGQLQNSITCSENRAEISPAIPGAKYTFTLQEATGTAALAEPFEYDCPAAKEFSGYNITTQDLSFKLYKAPNIVYTNEFKSTDSIYMLINRQKKTTSSADVTTILYVIRDENGNAISCDSTRLVWNKMWTSTDCILAIPYTPEASGSYTICLYFNGQLVTQQPITVKNAAD